MFSKSVACRRAFIALCLLSCAPLAVFSQAVTVVARNDSALLITTPPPCTSACADSARVEWRYGGQYVVRVVKKSAIDTTRVLRNLATSPYTDSARLSYTIFSKTPGFVSAAAFVAPIAVAASVAATDAGSATPAASSSAAASAPPPIPSAPPSGTTGGTPNRVTLPRVYLDTMVKSARSFAVKRTIAVTTRAALQAAIDTARGGDAILLKPGVTYVGSIQLKRKPAGGGWIMIRTSGRLPPAGTRYRPSQHDALPRIIASTGTDAVITTEAGAHHYLLQGIEVTSPPGATTGFVLVALGTNGPQQSTLASQPSQLVLDRVYVHGSPTFGFQRCVLLNSGAAAIVDSWLSECHGKGFDSQAILGYNGSGPFKIQNNYLEGAGENVMFGGADASSPAMLPSDIEIRGNHFFKPLSWKGGVWSVKNLLEIKVGVRVLIEGNVFENCWVDGQGGFAVLFKTVNQNRSAPFAETRDVTFRGNIVRNTTAGIGLAALPEGTGGVPMTRVAILDNWFETTGDDPMFTTTSVAYVFIEHNTALTGRGAMRFNGGNAPDSVVFRGNIFGTLKRSPDEVISGDGVALGTPTMQLYARSWLVQQNVFIGTSPRLLPAGNYFPLSPGAVGFSNWPNDVSLVPNSAFANLGLGAPIAKLKVMQQWVIEGFSK